MATTDGLELILPRIFAGFAVISVYIMPWELDSCSHDPFLAGHLSIRDYKCPHFFATSDVLL